MNLRDYLIALSVGTVAALSAAGIVLFAIDPATAGALAFLALYVTLGAGAVGLFSIVGTLARVSRDKTGDVGVAVARSLRQGVFFAVLFLASLYLSSRDMLTIWTVVLLVLLVTLVEFFFLAGKKNA
ncbi:hypothetical protein HYS28_01220 [Candidatus Uhrbacteria bacterium]|nr:hypothetical protein [Candidatus Uhrbacteria bacterium]